MSQRLLLVVFVQPAGTGRRAARSCAFRLAGAFAPALAGMYTLQPTWGTNWRQP